MSRKTRKIIAIIAVALILIFTVAFILYLFDKGMFNGGIGGIAIWSGGIGFLLWAVLWLDRAFPSQQVKDEEQRKLYDEVIDAPKKEDEKNSDLQPKDE